MTKVNTTGSTGGGTGSGNGSGSGSGCSLVNNIHINCGNGTKNVTNGGDAGGTPGVGNGTVVNNCNSTNVLLNQ